MLQQSRTTTLYSLVFLLFFVVGSSWFLSVASAESVTHQTVRKPSFRIHCVGFWGCGSNSDKAREEVSKYYSSKIIESPRRGIDNFRQGVANTVDYLEYSLEGVVKEKDNGCVKRAASGFVRGCMWIVRPLFQRDLTMNHERSVNYQPGLQRVWKYSFWTQMGLLASYKLLQSRHPRVLEPQQPGLRFDDSYGVAVTPGQEGYELSAKLLTELQGTVLIEKGYKYKFILRPLSVVNTEQVDIGLTPGEVAPTATEPVTLLSQQQESGGYLLKATLPYQRLVHSSCTAPGVCQLSAYSIEAVLVDDNEQELPTPVQTSSKVTYLVPPAPVNLGVGENPVTTSNSASLSGHASFFGTKENNSGWDGLERNLKCWFHVTAIASDDQPLNDDDGNPVYDYEGQVVSGACPFNSDADVHYQWSDLLANTEYAVTFIEQLGDDQSTRTISDAVKFRTKRENQLLPVVEDPPAVDDPQLPVRPTEPQVNPLINRDNDDLQLVPVQFTSENLGLNSVAPKPSFGQGAYITVRSVTLRKKSIKLPLLCTDVSGCAGAVKVTVKKTNIHHSAQFVLKQGHKSAVKITLLAREVALLRKAKKGHLRATVVFTDQTHHVTSQRSLILTGFAKT